MEFIRYLGDLKCPTCHRIEDDRVVCNQFFEGRQIYLYVCRNCGEWVSPDLGCEPAGRIPPEVRERLKKPDYGTNWQ